jgi:hypothetical protein
MSNHDIDGRGYVTALLRGVAGHRLPAREMAAAIVSALDVSGLAVAHPEVRRGVEELHRMTIALISTVEDLDAERTALRAQVEAASTAVSARRPRMWRVIRDESGRLDALAEDV